MIRFNVITLFPEMFGDPFNASILKRARDRGLIKITPHNLRDYCTDKHRVTDDLPYGGGGGMVMKPEPLVTAIEALQSSPAGVRTVLMTPQGKPFTQCDAERRSGQKLFRKETLIAILLILLIALITYGLSIPKLGYYHDDCYLLWSGQARGAQSIIPLFSTDRPVMGVVYSYVYMLLGDAIAGWHWYALLWRLIGGLAFFWILRLLWPREKYITTLMAVLFMVYPGFLSQPNANTKQNHLYGFGTALLSLALMLEAMKTDRRGWKIFCSLFSLLRCF